MAWGSIRGILSKDQDQSPKADTVATQASVPFTKGSTDIHVNRVSLDSIGQRSEVVRLRISSLLDRLDEARSLHDEFASIVGPLSNISDELSRTIKRNAELEAGLLQERDQLSEVRKELLLSQRGLAELSTQHEDASSRADKAETGWREALEELESGRVWVAEKVAAAENMERQLFVESEQRAALVAENKALRVEAQNADSALTEAEHDRRGLNDRFETIADENRRLLQLSEEQAVQLAATKSRLDDSETQWELDRERLRRAHTELATERAERERIHSQYEIDVGQQRNDRAATTAKFEASIARIASLEQALTQVHGQLRERDEFIRSNERAGKEAVIARTTAERRLEAMIADVERQRDRFVDMQRQRAEAVARAEMLAKAMAAKDLAIDQTNARHAQLVERIDQLNAKHAAVRSELETANRRLLEDLENERSERLFAQGALDIARESRTTLQRQHDALKRSGRGWHGDDSDENGDGSESNVTSFADKPKKRR